MLNVYISALSCFIFLLINLLYSKYISNKPIDVRGILYNTFIMALSIFGSFEILNKILPSLGINIVSSIMHSGGKPNINVFTNDPSF
jgi:hypothetical protein